MGSIEYTDFVEEWLPFNDLNILLSWDVMRDGRSVFLDIVIYQPRHMKLVDESLKIHKEDFKRWVTYLEQYTSFDLCRDRLLHIARKNNEQWIDLSWEDIT